MEQYCLPCKYPETNSCNSHTIYAFMGPAGRKHGPAIWFFKSGKIYEHTTYFENKKNGLTKRYYETGELYEETNFEAGEELPGKKKYSKDGKLID